jgi:hypothetical protein
MIIFSIPPSTHNQTKMLKCELHQEVMMTQQIQQQAVVMANSRKPVVVQTAQCLKAPHAFHLLTN